MPKFEKFFGGGVGTGEKLPLTNGAAGYDLVCTQCSSGRGGAPDNKYSMSYR